MDEEIRPQQSEPITARMSDALRRWRRLESDVYQQLAEELFAAGVLIDAGQLAWVVDEANARLRKAAGQ